MKNGETALAFTSGYLFGRRHKVRWALTFAGVAAGKRLVSGLRPGAGPEGLKSSELGKLAKEVRGQLVSAGRTAAVSAASSRIDALSDQMERRASTLRSGSGGADGRKPEAEGEDEERGDEGRGDEERGDERRGDERRGGDKSGAKNRGEKAASRSHDSKPKKSADRPAKAKAKNKPASGGSERRSQG